MKASTFLGLGSNQGDRRKNILSAIDLIGTYIGEVISQSPVYETEPWRLESSDEFLNIVIKVLTELTPMDLLKKTHEIEKRLGRTRNEMRYSSRTNDIDILLYNSKILNKKILKVPHPMIPERRFVLVPLCDIEPEGIHPVLNKTFSELLKACSDQKKVRKWK